MTQHNRNIVVGLTVAIALGLLGWMMLRFSDAPFRLFAAAQIPVVLEAPTSEGLSDGSPLYYKGVNIGRVTHISRSPDQTRVLIESLVDAVPPPPGNVQARIRTTLFGGTASITLALPTTRRVVETAQGPMEQDVDIPPEGSLEAGQTVQAVFVGVDLLPREFTILANDLTFTSQAVRRFAQEFQEARVFDQIRASLESFQRALGAAEKTFASADSLLNDKEMRQNLAQSLSNLREASESATRLGKDLELLATNATTRVSELADSGSRTIESTRVQIETRSRQVGDILDQLALALRSLNSAAAKIDKGEGTAGKMVNDPALYEALLDSTKELNLTIKDLRRLVDQWEKEGVSLRLNK
jgi:phospholipid/cholesterol/gamma-HCH transport system substrate-binding protein